MLWSCSIRLRVSVVLPAPGGDDRISNSPRRPKTAPSATPLLHVLDMLPELIDGRLQIEADPRHGHVVGLGAERVRLPAEFLGQEVETAADRAAGAQEVSRGGDMRAQAVDFFPDVGARREKNRFLVQPRRIERSSCIEQLGDLSLKPRPDGLRLPRRTRLGGLDKALHRIEVPLDDPGQRAALRTPSLLQSLDQTADGCAQPAIELYALR